MSGDNPKAVALVRRHNPQLLPFSKLPKTAQKAITTRADEVEGEIDRKRLFGYVELPLEELKEIIMDDLRAEDAPFETFEDYHDWYISHNDTPRHRSVWPIMLNLLDDGMGVIDDGSHRFHSYVRSGVNTIPALFDVEEFSDQG